VSDALVLARAIDLRRVLVTHNIDHFRREHAEVLRPGRTHHGILGVPQRGSVERRTIRVAMLLDWIADQEHGDRLVVWGDLQQQLHRGLHLPAYSEPEVRLAIGRD
jgi:hypothetical protein